MEFLDFFLLSKIESFCLEMSLFSTLFVGDKKSGIYLADVAHTTVEFDESAKVAKPGVPLLILQLY